MMISWGNNLAYQQELLEICNTDLPFDILKNQKILITGANGMICSYLVDVLMEANLQKNLNLQITALVRSEEKGRARFEKYLESQSFLLLVGDVCQSEVFENNLWDYIIHGAGNAHPIAFATQPVETMTSNFLGSANLLNYALSKKSVAEVKKILFLSTGEVYGHAAIEQETGWKESDYGMIDSMDIRSCYPESKRAAETLFRSYEKEYNIHSVIVRLAYIYGATITKDNSRADAQFLRNAVIGEDILMKSTGSQFRSYCYLQDAACAILIALLIGISGEAYNVANKESNLTILQYAKQLAATFGVKIRMELPETVEKEGYSKMKQEILDASKLEKLGWKPQNNIKQGLQKIKNILIDEGNL